MALILVVVAITAVYFGKRAKNERFPGFTQVLEAPGSHRLWTVPSQKIEMVLLDAGSFAMGAENGNPNEKPVTQVTITKPFWMARTAVTQRQWKSVMKTSVAEQMAKAKEKSDTLAARMANMTLALDGEGGDYPMYYVSWTEATEFCRKLSERRTSGWKIAGRLHLRPSDRSAKGIRVPSGNQWRLPRRFGHAGMVRDE